MNAGSGNQYATMFIIHARLATRYGNCCHFNTGFGQASVGGAQPGGPVVTGHFHLSGTVDHPGGGGGALL